jgi:hypothetical protein
MTDADRFYELYKLAFSELIRASSAHPERWAGRLSAEEVARHAYAHAEAGARSLAPQFTEEPRSYDQHAPTIPPPLVMPPRCSMALLTSGGPFQCAWPALPGLDYCQDHAPPGFVK